MSIRNQILLPVILMAVLLVGSALGVSIWQFSGYVNNSVMDETNRSLKGLADEVDGQKQDALVKAKVLAGYPGLAAAIAANDTNAVLALATPIVKELKLDFLTVTNATGAVVARTHEPAKRGDSAVQSSVLVPIVFKLEQ